MKKIIDTPNAPKAVGPYSQAVDTGNMLLFQVSWVWTLLRVRLFPRKLRNRQSKY